METLLELFLSKYGAPHPTEPDDHKSSIRVTRFPDGMIFSIMILDEELDEELETAVYGLILENPGEAVRVLSEFVTEISRVPTKSEFEDDRSCSVLVLEKPGNIVILNLEMKAQQDEISEKSITVKSTGDETMRVLQIPAVPFK
jgi:hypothetical protein